MAESTDDKPKLRPLYRAPDGSYFDLLDVKLIRAYDKERDPYGAGGLPARCVVVGDSGLVLAETTATTYAEALAAADEIGEAVNAARREA